MPKEKSPDFSLFLDILHTLEHINAPYMVIGAFAAILYGASRTTYDIDIVVDLNWGHIQALVSVYPPPRYYADALQMVESVAMGIMFNIIDTSRGEKADLVPLPMEPRYRFAFERRIRQRVDLMGEEPFDIWCARPEDVIIGKLMAWAEGQSRKHETDIYEMLTSNLVISPMEAFNLAYIDEQVVNLGIATLTLWNQIKDAASHT